jgi:hypothetical protein
MTDNYHSLQLTYGCIFFETGTIGEFCSIFTVAIFALRNSLLFAGVGRSHFSSPDGTQSGAISAKGTNTKALSVSPGMSTILDFRF